MKRRALLGAGVRAAGLSALSPLARADMSHTAPAVRQDEGRRSLRIADVDSNFEREPLRRPFGFKGGYMSEIWQTAALAVSPRH